MKQKDSLRVEKPQYLRESKVKKYFRGRWLINVSRQGGHKPGNMENLENSGNLKNCQNSGKSQGNVNFCIKTWKTKGK